MATLALVLTVTVGAAAGISVLALVRSLSSVPFVPGDPDGIVLIFQRNAELERSLGVSNLELAHSWPTLQDLRRRARTLDQLAAFRRRTARLGWSGREREVNAVEVGPGFFEALGASSLMGLTLDELEASQEETGCVIGYGLWRGLLGGEGPLGLRLSIAGRPCEVAGVMPPGFDLPEIEDGAVARRTDVWLPLGDPPGGSARSDRVFALLGRLRDDVQLSTVRAELAALGEDFAAANPAEDGGWEYSVVTLRDYAVRDARSPIAILMLAAGALCLASASNFAGLYLSRVSGRHPELATRWALGANRLDLFRLFLRELAAPVAIGVGAGLGAGAAALRIIANELGGMVPCMQALRLHAPDVAAAGAGALILSAAVAGLGVRLFDRQRRRDGSGCGSRGQRQATGARVTLVSQRLAVVMQNGFGLLVVMFAAVALLQFLELATRDAGVRTDGVVTAEIAIPDDSYQGRESQFFEDLIAGVKATGSRELVSGARVRPLEGSLWRVGAQIEDAAPSPWSRTGVETNVVLPGYFATLGIPLLSGEDFEGPAAQRLRRPVVVSDSAARLLWPGVTPIGRRIKLQHPESDWSTVIGVVADVIQRDLKSSPEPTVYELHRDRPQRQMVLLSCCTDDLEGARSAIGVAVSRLDRRIPVKVASFSQVVWQSILGERVRALIVGILAWCAVTLVFVGVFALSMFQVTGESASIGIRLTLGMTRSRLVLWLTGRAAGLSAIGVALGLVAWPAAAGLVSPIVVERSPLHLSVLAGVALLMMAIGAFGGFLPALRISRTGIVRLIEEA